MRAAYWVAGDGQSDVRLTTEEHAGLPEVELLAEAQAEATRVGLVVGGGRLVVGEYR